MVQVPEHSLEYSLRKTFNVTLGVCNVNIRSVLLLREDLGLQFNRCGIPLNSAGG